LRSVQQRKHEKQQDQKQHLYSDKRKNHKHGEFQDEK
jgi:hypothetical protein